MLTDDPCTAGNLRASRREKLFGVKRKDTRGIILPFPDPLPLVPLEQFQIPAPELNSYLLMWDHLALAVPLGSRYWGPNEEFLASEGILKVVDVSRQAASAARDRLLSSGLEPPLADKLSWNAAAYRVYDKEERGLWTLAVPKGREEELIFTEYNRALLVRLHQTIPVPTKDVPIEDILEFRERRLVERLQLRFELERTYQAILNSPDRELSFATELEALSNAIQDLLKTLEEARISFRFVGLEARLKYELDFHTAFAGAAAGGLLSGINAALALGIAGLMTNLLPKIEVETSYGLRGTYQRETPFQYALLIGREL